MTALSITTTDQESARQISQVLEANGLEPSLVRPGEFLGEATDFLVAAAEFATAVTALMVLLRDLIERGKVKQVTVGDTTLDSPTVDAAEQLLRSRPADG